jgi:hypothetical protein
MENPAALLEQNIRIQEIEIEGLERRNIPKF